MSEEAEDPITIHLFNRQSIRKRIFLFIVGGMLFAAGAAGSVWTLEQINEDALTPNVGLSGLASLLGLYLGYRTMDLSRFKYVATTASS